MALSPSCEQCMKTGFCKDKSGLPVFLVLYGIATKIGTEGQHFEKGTAYLNGHNLSDSKAPELSGQFKVDADIPLGDCTMYALRPLRGGYLYTYDQARDKWEAHFVTDNAFLEQLPGAYRDPKERQATLDSGRAPCQARNYAKAAYLTVPDPDNASIVWIAFSDVEWTKDVFDRHQNAAYRARHMRKFDVQAWMGSLTHEHAGKIEELAKHVADFAEGVNEGAFMFSPSAQGSHAFPLLARCGGLFWKTGNPDRPLVSNEELGQLPAAEQTRIARLKNEDGSPNKPAPSSAAAQIIAASERILPGKGVILALDDPVGITQSLAELMEFRLDAFNMQERYGKGRAVEASANIVALRDAIYSQAAQEVVDAMEAYDESIKDRAITEIPGSPDFGRLENWEKYKEETGFMDADSSGWQTEKWKSYQYDSKDVARFVEEKRANFQQQYDDAHKQYVEKVIGPIAEAHARWMKSQTLADVFICNFSTTEPLQGGEYTHILSLCMADTQDKTACSMVYTGWMDGSVTDETNLLLRGMVLNQDEFANSFDEFIREQDALIAAQRAELNRLLSEQDDRENKKTADAATLIKVKEFAIKWGSIRDSVIKQSQRIVVKAFGHPSDQGFVDKLLGRPSDMPENTPLGRLMMQASGGAIQKHLSTIATGKESTFNSLLNVHNRSHTVSITIEGTERQIADLMMRTLFNNKAVGNTHGARSLIEHRLREIFGPPNPNAPVKSLTTRVSFNVDALLEAVENNKGMEKLPKSAVKAYTDILFGKFTIEEAALNSLEDTLQLRSGENVHTFCKRVVEARAQIEQRQQRILDRRIRVHKIGSTKTIYTSFGFIMAIVGLSSALQSMEQAKKWDDETEKGFRFSAALSVFIGATADTAMQGLIVAGRINDTMRVFARSARITVGKGLRLTGRVFGAAGAGINAAFDFAEMWKEGKKGNGVLAGAYFASGLLSATSAYLMAVNRKASGKKAWILLIVTMGFSHLISYLKDTHIHEYLNKCEFGNQRDPKWTVEDERNMFQSATEI